MPIKVAADAGVVTISIAGEDVTNAITPEMTLELHRALLAFDADRSARVAILRGDGAGSFSVGMEASATRAMLDDMRTLNGVARHYVYPAQQRPISPWIAWRTLLGRRTVKPIVAAVRGDCLGLGLMILGLHSDVRIAAEGARFGFPDIHRGGGSAQALVSRLTNQIPLTAVHWLVQTGLLMDAREAHRCFLVNEIVPDSQLDARADETAARICNRPALALRAEKLAAIHLERAEYEDAIVLGSALAALSASTDQP